MRNNPSYSPISIIIGAICGLAVALGMGWPGINEFIIQPLKAFLATK